MNLLALSQNPIIVFLASILLGLLVAIIIYPIIRTKVLALKTFKKRTLYKYDLIAQNFLNHPVLAYLEFQQTGIKHLVYENPKHAEIVKDMLNILFAIYKKNIKDFIAQGVVLSDKFTFKKLVETTLLNMDKACEAEWMKLDLENKEELIRNFHQWQSKETGFLYRAITNVTMANIYDNNIERMREILSLLQIKLDMTIPDIDEGFGLPQDNRLRHYPKQ